LKSTVEHGLEEVVQTAAAFGLTGFEGADFRDSGGELALERERWNGCREGFELPSVDLWNVCPG
jgi:hypothetical protein